jgi:transposase
LTGAHWGLVEPLLPAPFAEGRAEKHLRREVVGAILYLVRTGCAWRQLPRAFAAHEQTVYWHFKQWRADGTVDRIYDGLREAVRDVAGRDPAASAGSSIDVQSVKGPDTVEAATRDYDAGKGTNGRKRHVAVDALGLLVVVMLTAASVQDRHAAGRLLDRVRFGMPSMALVFADGGYTARLITYARQVLRTTVEVVAMPEGQRGFPVLPRRWVVERTLAWLVRCRRPACDYERLPQHAEAMVKWAMMGLMTRRLAPAGGRGPSEANQTA